MIGGGSLCWRGPGVSFERTAEGETAEIRADSSRVVQAIDHDLETGIRVSRDPLEAPKPPDLVREVAKPVLGNRSLL
jgi:hypothetical protein